MRRILIATLLGTVGVVVLLLLSGCESEPTRTDIRVDKKREDKILPTWKAKEKSWWE